MTAAVVTADGAWAGASGVDGARRPVAADSAMAIGALTETFVAAEVLLLAAAGQVDLGAPVTDYVPLPFDARGASVRQSLAMRSGFPLDSDGRLADAVVADPDRPWRAQDVLALVDPYDGRAGQLGGSTFPKRPQLRRARRAGRGGDR